MCCVNMVLTRLNMNMYLLISPAQKFSIPKNESKQSNANNSVYYSILQQLNMLNKTNIIYVFNSILLTNVFATDLR